MPTTELIRLRDGCQLATDIHLPEGGVGRFPVLLMMTPYGRTGLRRLAEPFTAAGYAVIIQDVRGRGDSDGEFRPIAQEKEDGPETVEWIKRQPWFAPEAGIGIIGISYLGEVGLAVAARCPEVRAMLNVGSMADFYDVSHQGGALKIHHALPWTILTSRSPQPSLRGDHWLETYATWPLHRAAAAAGFPNRLWEEAVAHPNRDSYWEVWSVRDDLPQVNIPILHFSGWYDLCLDATLQLFSYFQEKATAPQQLFLGPWSHNGVVSGQRCLAGVDFGEDSSSQLIVRALTWFDRYLRQRADAQPDGAAVNLWLNGDNRWLSSQQWPPAESVAAELYLSAAGTLTQEPVPSGSCSFTHNPENPAPTQGGSVWEFPPAGLNPGPVDQSPLLERTDTLCFRTPALSAPLTLAGPAECRLFASISGETADFVVRLVDILPDGQCRFVADGILRAHYRMGDHEIQPVQPGIVEEYRVDLCAVGHTFRPGHRLGLIISGASFPKWDINRGTLSGHIRPIQQTVHFGEQYPSALLFHQLKQG
ncbi:MAG: CocE/NonD family hydrolase [Bacillota bacterium]|jgi:putative CocE/NonD family hydrolase